MVARCCGGYVCFTTGEVKWHVVAPQLVSAAAFMMLPLLMRASVVLAMAGLMLSTGTYDHTRTSIRPHPSIAVVNT